MIKWLILFLLLPAICVAQTYKYIGVEDGLSNRRVYSIQKDHKGYMWFLTQEGMDRYDGSEFKHYRLVDGTEQLSVPMGVNWLYIDDEGRIWVIGQKGRVYLYNYSRDTFVLTYKIPESEMQKSLIPISFSFIDNQGNIWLCGKERIFLYNTHTEKSHYIENKISPNITNLKQIDETHFYVGSDVGIHHAELKDGRLQLLPCKELDNLEIQVTELYFHGPSNKLFIGAFQHDLFVYDSTHKKIIQPKTGLPYLNVSCIKPLSEKELLVATNGAGVYKINVDSYEKVPYILADYELRNGMNGNNINDIFIDEDRRIWLANYPIGITMRNNRYSSYKWIKHAVNNEQSLVNDRVNTIIEDSEGDLWFATSNGISQYNMQTKKWYSYPGNSVYNQTEKNQIFTTLCEVYPGIIWAGGYNSGIFQMNKRTNTSQYILPNDFNKEDTAPDRYIRDIVKDFEGNIWSGGYYYLKRRNLKDQSYRIYNGFNSITTLLEKDPTHMWVACATGLFLLNKNTDEREHIKLPIESNHIYSLYQTAKGLLYIGTGGYGLLIYNPTSKLFTHYHEENSALISNHVYSILSHDDMDILLSTENGLSSYYPKEGTFHNWTKDQGLMTVHFNPNSGTLLKNGHYIIGSTDGAVEFDKQMKIPQGHSSKMVFSDFRLFYQTVYPDDEDSPLTQAIDETEVLRLKSNQNIFSLKVSSINYDYPSNTLYSWKLEGFYNEWSRPEKENIIRFTNLNPGTYNLRVRAVSSEDRRVIEERNLKIEVDYPFWRSAWAVIIYIFVTGLIVSAAFRVFILSKQRKESDEKIQFFINTAHDIRTPLTLIKAPIEELQEKENLSKDGVSNLNTALRNVNALLRLTANLINFERIDTYSSDLFVGEHEVNTFITDIYESFRPYAEVKLIDFTYQRNFTQLYVWFDKDKMDSILKNIISNAIKYTPDHGEVTLTVDDWGDTWSVEVKDSGIGIPSNEQRKLFKNHFRGSNAINSMITGSGIGLMLVWKLVRLHKGKITMNSVENQGATIKVTFPKEIKKHRKVHLANQVTNQLLPWQSGSKNAAQSAYDTEEKSSNAAHERILIVEDNDELRDYLTHSLSAEYDVQSCTNGKIALLIVPEYKPDLVISDIMMPEMRGDELCSILKSNIETSHIPVVLLTALNGERNILAGLHVGADEYVVKPFNVNILKATIKNILANRALLRNRYANPEVISTENDCINCATDLDWKFIATVKKHVEENLDNSAFTVDVLCNLMNMSRTSFYYKIKALTDQAPGDYIRIIRLTRAAHLLQERIHSVTEVAELTGFNDAKYFREVFKKHFGVSPSQYAKKKSAQVASAN